MKAPDISRFIEFYKLLLQFRAIKRKVYIPPANKETENNAEHSYMLAMAAWYLAQYFPKIDRDKVIRMALAHDLLEVHAGDTFTYGEERELASQKEREEAALTQLEKEWPDFPELFTETQDYEGQSSEEAKFLQALDKLMPTVMDFIGDGYAWHKHDITFDRFKQEKGSKLSESSEIHEYYKQLVELLKQKPGIFPG